MSERPPSLRAHLAALASLAGLLALSVVLAHFRLGVVNVIAGPAIAALKAAVVLIFFMKLGRSSAGIRLAACFGFAWVGILIVLTLGDFLNRVPITVLP
jgi:cytochrome c oxidase subunit 4